MPKSKSQRKLEARMAEAARIQMHRLREPPKYSSVTNRMRNTIRRQARADSAKMVTDNNKDKEK